MTEIDQIINGDHFSSNKRDKVIATLQNAYNTLEKLKHNIEAEHIAHYNTAIDRLKRAIRQISAISNPSDIEQLGIAKTLVIQCHQALQNFNTYPDQRIKQMIAEINHSIKLLVT